MLPPTTRLLQICVCLAVLGLGQRAIARTIPPCSETGTPNAASRSSLGSADATAPCATDAVPALSGVDLMAVEFSAAVSPSALLALDAEAIAPTLDLDPAVIENSPVLQRWLEQVPDVADEIRNQPSFRTRLRVGYVQFPSTGQISGVGAAVEDVFVVPGTGLTASAAYSRSWNGQREDYGSEFRYYLLPLGGYVNIAPTVGYRSLSTPDYQTNGLDVGLRLMLVPSRGGGADLTLSQRWVAPGNEGEVGITSLAVGYAVTSQLRLGTDFQLQNSRFGQDSRLGISLELLL
ncbi:MAG: hypothetical protein AAFW95_04250 [Cyanobacteria bacterium J06638_6]